MKILITVKKIILLLLILFQIKMLRDRNSKVIIENYNRLKKRLILKRRLKFESAIVKKESIITLNDFESIDYQY